MLGAIDFKPDCAVVRGFGMEADGDEITGFELSASNQSAGCSVERSLGGEFNGAKIVAGDARGDIAGFDLDEGHGREG